MATREVATQLCPATDSPSNIIITTDKGRLHSVTSNCVEIEREGKCVCFVYVNDQFGQIPAFSHTDTHTSQAVTPGLTNQYAPNSSIHCSR